MLNILEIGCGKGRHTEFLRKKFQASVFGIDISEQNIAAAKTAYPESNFAVMSAENLKFDDKFFNLIYAIDVLEHVDDLPKTVTELSRVMAVGGKLVVNVPASRSEAWLAKIRSSYAEDMHHVRVFTDTQLEKAITPAGFKLVAHKNEGFSDHLILYYVMTRPGAIGDHQLGIGNWRDSWLGRILFACHAFSKPNLVFESWLKYIPLWLIGLPIGFLINLVGNRFMPKSQYYEFQKIAHE